MASHFSKSKEKDRPIHPNSISFRGIHHDPYAKKCEMLKKIISSSELDVAAAYGGPKDLQIYRSINIPTRSIFVVGSKGKNKIQNMGTVSPSNSYSSTNGTLGPFRRIQCPSGLASKFAIPKFAAVC